VIDAVHPDPADRHRNLLVQWAPTALAAVARWTPPPARSLSASESLCSSAPGVPEPLNRTRAAGVRQRRRRVCSGSQQRVGPPADLCSPPLPPPLHHEIKRRSEKHKGTARSATLATVCVRCAYHHAWIMAPRHLIRAHFPAKVSRQHIPGIKDEHDQVKTAETSCVHMQLLRAFDDVPVRIPYSSVQSTPSGTKRNESFPSEHDGITHSHSKLLSCPNSKA
jgi:hypothetical protein